MIQENELVMLIIGIGVLFFIQGNLDKIRTIPYPGKFLASFFAFFCGWVATVIEGFMFPDIFNLIEHCSYAIGAVFAAIWCWNLFQLSKKDTDEFYSDT